MTDLEKATPQPPAPRRFHSRGELPISQGTLRYEAEAGWLALREGSRERKRAEVFYTYYKKDDGDPRRPLTFVFNGGPGAASAYLHLGAIGPKRAMTTADGKLPPAPARLVDNPECWLPFTDLVFVDPVGTGLSRTVEDEADKDAKKDEDTFYWSVKSDLESLCGFFERFLSHSRRWASPIALAGESYGGYRVARLAKLVQEHGIGLSAAFLISPALEWDFIFGGRFDTLNVATLFPSFAAAGYSHGLAGAGRSIGEHLAEAESFALRTYLPAISAAALDDGALDPAVAAKAAALTGLSADFLQRRGGRVDMMAFSRELLRSRKQVVGLYDAGVTGDDPLPESDTYLGLEPTLDGQNRLFTTAANAHLRENLGVDDERRYHLVNLDVNRKWTFGDTTTGDPMPAGACADLVAGMASNPEMEVLITHGYHDLVTPYFVTNYAVGLLRNDSPAAKRIRLQHYEGGHMFYTREASRKAFTQAAAEVFARLAR